jgi:hypothetical protein
MDRRPVASIELLMGLSVDPRSRGAVKRQPNGFVVTGAVVVVTTPKMFTDANYFSRHLTPCDRLEQQKARPPDRDRAFAA